MRIWVVAVPAVLLLTGCVQLQSVESRLEAVTLADARRAAEIAKAAMDSDGQNCAEAIAAQVGQKGQQPSVPVGPLSVFMAARELRRDIQRGIPAEVRQKCAVVILDAEKTMTRLGIGVFPGSGAMLGFRP